MSEQLKNMKDAVMHGQGGGLQSASTSVGETIAENTDMSSSSSKKADDASKSLGDFSKGKGEAVSGTNVKASDQMANQETGSADHLGLSK